MQVLCARPFTFLCPTSGCFPPSFPWKRLALLIASSNCHGVCALSSLFVSWTFYRLFFLLLGHGLQWVFSETFSCFSMCKYIEVHYEGNHMFCFCKWNCANKCFKTDKKKERKKRQAFVLSISVYGSRVRYMWRTFPPKQFTNMNARIISVPNVWRDMAVDQKDARRDIAGVVGRWVVQTP